MESETNSARATGLPCVAVVAGPTATILNTPPLVTSAKARRKYGIQGPIDRKGRYDALRPQRLAAPVTVYIEQFSAHPLEMDAAEMYAAADGFVAPDGTFSKERSGPADKPVYEVRLLPEDGLYLLPYMGRRRDGSAWETGAEFDEPGHFRQSFFPDAARLFEEIDRFEVDHSGHAGTLSALAQYDFYRSAPSGGYTKGCASGLRSDVGEGAIAPERVGADFFPYWPRRLRREPPRSELAVLTKLVQHLARDGRYRGVLWLEGSPYVEETAYWLHLLIDSKLPIVCTAAANLNAGSRQNVITAVEYICSDVWRDKRGRDQVGVVGAFDGEIICARELVKRDARVGGFGAAGGYGGVVARFTGSNDGLMFRPGRLGTYRSEVRFTTLPRSVLLRRRDAQGLMTTERFIVRDGDGISPRAIPDVRIITHARYLQDGDADPVADAAEVRSLISHGAERGRLAGIVAAGGTPYGDMSGPVEASLHEAILSGIPVVKVGRGEPEGHVPHALAGLAVAGSNLTAIKARLLLMACIMRFGPPPSVSNIIAPDSRELESIRKHLRRYQIVFNTH